MKTSIVMATKNKEDLLRRSLESYSNLTCPDYEFILVDDNGNAPLDGLVSEYRDRLPIQYLRLADGNKDRTPAVAWNRGFELSTGEFVIFVMSDVIVSGKDLIERYQAQFKTERINVNTYKLSQTQTAMLDTIDWKSDPNIIKTLPKFWDEWVDGQPNSARLLAGLITNLTGMSREMWKWFGLFREEKSHLTADQDLVLRDMALGRGVDTLNDYVAFHQWHPPAHVTMAGGWKYENERQARLLEPAPKE